MNRIAPLLVAVVLLLVALGVAKRFIAGLGIPSGWVSVPRILGTCIRIVTATTSGLWRAGRGIAHLVEKRRRIRRRPTRASIGTLR